MRSSIPSHFQIFILFISVSLAISLFLLVSNAKIQALSSASVVQFKTELKVFVADLPRSLNYGMLDLYWSPSTKPDARISSDPDHDPSLRGQPHDSLLPPFPENPIIKQYSAEYWITGDLVTPAEQRKNSFARRVHNIRDADVIFVPFFAALSAEMELAKGKGTFRKKDGNDDYKRQREMVDIITASEAWKRSAGRDHVFVLTDPVAMWHVRSEISAAIFLVVDFGGWYKLDRSSSSCSVDNSSSIIHHTQVSLLKDVIVPYTYLLPRLLLSSNTKRHTLLYFKGAKHRQRGGLVREKLWDLLVNEPGVIMEEGFPNATGREQSISGMRNSEFCLHPAGDTPTSCRLFDAIQSLCIPVIVSDNIELPFEGIIDYTEFSIFVSVVDALQPNWLANHLRSVPDNLRSVYRQNMAEVQPMFGYDNGIPGGVGPIPVDGAVNYVWKKVHQKLPMIKEAIVRERRKPSGVSMPLRCKCT